MTLRMRFGVFGAFAACVLLANARVVRALYEFSRADETASHLILIPLVTATLIYQSRRSIFSRVESARRSGLAVLGMGVVLLIVARVSDFGTNPPDSLTLSIGALVVLLVGAFLLAFGAAAFRAARFPLLFLIFAIPIPTAILDIAVQLLKTGSTEAVAGLFTMTGTPYYRDGFVFNLSTVAIEVADECSGIRSSIALVLTGVLAGHMFLTNSWSRIMLVAMILPISVLKNGIRIVGLSLLAMHVDPGFLTGQLHHEGGIVFFLLALVILAPVLFLLFRFEQRASRPLARLIGAKE